MAKTIALRAIVLLLLVVVGQSAAAAVSYSFVADPNPFFTQLGTSMPVRLYLAETLTGGSTSLIDADGGMFSVGLKMTRIAGEGMLGAVTLNNTDFDGESRLTSSATSLQFYESIGNGRPGVTTGDGGSNSRTNMVYLGSVAISGTFSVGVFPLRPYDAIGGNTLTNLHAYDLDFDRATNAAYSGTSSNPTALTQLFDPEPNAAILLVAFASPLFVRRRSHRTFV